MNENSDDIVECRNCGQSTRHGVVQSLLGKGGRSAVVVTGIGQVAIWIGELTGFNKVHPDGSVWWDGLTSGGHEYVTALYSEAADQGEIEAACKTLDILYDYDVENGDGTGCDGQVEELKQRGWRFFDILELCRNGSGWQERFDIVKCRGCDTLAFRLRRIEEWREHRDPTTGAAIEAGESLRLYPPLSARPLPQWLGLLPPRVHGLMREVYQSLDAGASTLAVMGTRAVVDLLLDEQVGTEDGFAAKLRRYRDDAKAVTPQDFEVLNAVIEAGHAASHRGHVFAPRDLSLILNVVERHLERVYVFPQLSVELMSTIPKRPVRKPRIVNPDAPGPLIT